MGARALISEDLDLKWRETVVSLSISGDSSYHDHWRFSEIFERDQTLLPHVIERWFDILVATLPLDTRLRLISKIPEEVSSSTISGVVEALVSDDLAATQALFGRRGLGTRHRLGLSGEPSASWIARALVAMDHGWNVHEVVASSWSSGTFSWGDESEQWQSQLDTLNALRGSVATKADPRVEEIIDAGIEQYGRLRDSALADERRQRAFGRGAV